VLQDGTLQVTLYCHKYGIKRKRNSKDTPNKPQSGTGSPQFDDKRFKEDGRCQTKKTNCPFRLKFIKKPKEPFN
jgi:hypothetical protein